MSEEPGLSLYSTAHQIANAFVSNDIKELRKHYEYEEDFNRLIEYGWVSVGTPVSKKTINLSPYNIIIHDNSNSVLFYFLTVPENPDMESGIFIDIDMFLNENGEWKATSITTG